MRINYLVFIFLFFFSYRCSSQIFHYKHEIKLKREKKAEVTILKIIKDNKINILPNPSLGMRDTIRYSLEIGKNYILMNYWCEEQHHSRPQFPLRIGDTISFLSMSIDGFCHGQTDGEIVFLGDTIIKMKQHQFDCYHFLIFSNKKSDLNHYLNHRAIYLDKKTLLPIKVYEFYYNVEGEIITDAYKKTQLIRIRD